MSETARPFRLTEIATQTQATLPSFRPAATSHVHSAE
jgi:hypothetical protein